VLLMWVLRQGTSCVMLTLSLPQREVMVLWQALQQGGKQQHNVRSRTRLCVVGGCL
jgi:hypothetical protein